MIDVVGKDDANDGKGVPGECPGHEWRPKSVYLRSTGGSLSVECVWCGAVQYEPSVADGS